MSPQIKAMLAVLLGVLAGAVVIFISEMASMSMLHVDETMANDPERLNEFMHSASMGMFLTLLVGYALGSFVAGFVTNWRAKSMGIQYRPALIAGVALLVMGILNMLSLWHPVWFWVVSLPTYLVCAWLGGRLRANALKSRTPNNEPRPWPFFKWHEREGSKSIEFTVPVG